jgi:DnaJ-class molecular chaperone
MGNPFERPPGRPEMVSVKCPHCSGRGTAKDQRGNDTACLRCHGTGQVKTR